MRHFVQAWRMPSWPTSLRCTGCMHPSCPPLCMPSLERQDTSLWVSWDCECCCMWVNTSRDIPSVCAGLEALAAIWSNHLAIANLSVPCHGDTQVDNSHNTCWNWLLYSLVYFNRACVLIQWRLFQDTCLLWICIPHVLYSNLLSLSRYLDGILNPYSTFSIDVRLHTSVCTYTCTWSLTCMATTYSYSIFTCTYF